MIKLDLDAPAVIWALACVGVVLVVLGLRRILLAGRLRPAQGVVLSAACPEVLPTGKTTYCSVEVEYADGAGNKRRGTLRKYHAKVGSTLRIVYDPNALQGASQGIHRGSLSVAMLGYFVLLMGGLVIGGSAIALWQMRRRRA